MKNSNEAYLISSALGALVGLAIAVSLFEPGRQLILFPIAGALAAAAYIWASYSVALKVSGD